MQVRYSTSPVKELEILNTKNIFFSVFIIISPFFLLHYKDRGKQTINQIKLYTIQHILHFHWCHFCQSRTREVGIGLDVTPDLLRTKENNYYKIKMHRLITSQCIKLSEI